MFRELPLLNTFKPIQGRLFLSCMPGTDDTIEEFLSECNRHQIDLIASLTSIKEIAQKGKYYPEALKYLEMIQTNTLPCKRIEFPIQDYHAADDKYAFKDFIIMLKDELIKGMNVMIHCRAGHGRTGLVANCVLLALGLSQDEAYTRVHKHGSEPETSEQKDLIDWFSLYK